MRQNFPDWILQLGDNDELVIVDDFSTDQTYDLARSLCELNQTPYCKVIKASEDIPGKKRALADGINSSSKNYILVTDADCQPGPLWKSSMTAEIEMPTEILLGYAPFHKKPGFLNLFQRFECVLTALQYYSLAHVGFPYMGVGRNLLFKKSLFDESIYDFNAENSDYLASGDDDLLVSALANEKNTKTVLNPDSFVYSEAKKDWSSYFKQKSRHITSSVKYKPIIKLFLAIFSTTQIVSNLLFIPLIFTEYWKFALGLYFLKSITATLTYLKASRIFQERNLFYFTPIMELSLTLYYVILSLSYPFKKKTDWN